MSLKAGGTVDIIVSKTQFLKPCPHCRRKVRLSPLFRFLRQSHFSATVWTGLLGKLFQMVGPQTEKARHCDDNTTKPMSSSSACFLQARRQPQFFGGRLGAREFLGHRATLCIP